MYNRYHIYIYIFIHIVRHHLGVVWSGMLWNGMVCRRKLGNTSYKHTGTLAAGSGCCRYLCQHAVACSNDSHRYLKENYTSALPIRITVLSLYLLIANLHFEHPSSTSVSVCLSVCPSDCSLRPAYPHPQTHISISAPPARPSVCLCLSHFYPHR